jgi:hypothetical protein
VGELAPVHLLDFWKEIKIEDGNTPITNIVPKIYILKNFLIS